MAPAQAQAVDECSADLAPLADFSTTCSGGQCTFTSSSYDSNGWLIAQDWDFGDGVVQTGSSATASHLYLTDGIYYVSLSVVDNDQLAATAVRPIVVGSGGGVALATNDEIYVDQNVSTMITFAELLANDVPGVQFFQLESAPAHGSLQPASGGYTYRSFSTFEGQDSFAYSVTDGLQHVGEATVRIVVARAPPKANPDYLQTGVNVPVAFTPQLLLANDSTGAVFSSQFQNLNHGTVAFDKILESGQTQYVFTPTYNFAGIATFEYLISWDGNAPFEVGLVYVSVVDEPPSSDMWAPTCVNRTCTFRQHAADDLGIVDYFWQWGDGTSQHDSTGNDIVHTYAQSGRYVVRLTVTDTGGHASYQKCVPQNNVCAWYSSDREVTANTRPVAVNDTATTERDVAVTIPLLANDSDADGDPLLPYVVSVSNPGAQAQVIASGTSYALRFTPPDGYVGLLTVAYSVADSWGGVSANATVSITVTQWTSITDARGEQFSCPYQGTIPIQKSLLLSNDYDSDGDALSIVSIDSTLIAGFLDCTTDPTRCTFRALSGMTGHTFFRYTVTDPAGHRDTATVKIYVATTGTPPTLQNDLFTTIRNTPKPFTIQDIVQNDVDPDGDTLSVTLNNGARDFGAIQCSSPFYQCTYTPNSGFVGLDRFPYAASDIMNAPQTAYISMLTLPPATPTFDAREDFRYIPKNTTTWIAYSWLTTNDYDPERDPITVTSTNTTGLAGTLTCDTSGCNYAPGLNATGVTKFKYTATDGHGNSDTAIVKLRVASTNNAPPVTATDAFSTPKNTVLRFSVFDLLRDDYDADNDPLNVTVSTTNATKGVLSCGTPNYWCTYTPNANVTGVDTIIYSVADGSTYTASSLAITITP